MNVGVLLAGWPFATLLALYGQYAGHTPLCSAVRGKDHRSLWRDGYPVCIDEILVGDHVEVVQ